MRLGRLHGRRWWRSGPGPDALRPQQVPSEGCAPLFVNGKWLAQAQSGTQRYATEVIKAVVHTELSERLTLVLPHDAVVPEWARGLRTRRCRTRGLLFEQITLPWTTRRGHLYSMAGPAPIAKRNQTVVMHDAMPYRYPSTFRRSSSRA